ncbi:MAG: MFS transporter [Georgenia sp.]
MLALFATGVAAFAMVYVVQPLLPLVSAELDIDATRAALLLSVSTLAIAVAVIPLASLSERVGRGRMIGWGLTGAVVAGIASALAPTFALMLMARAVQGVATAGVPAAALAWVAENIAPSWVTRVAGLYIAGTTVGGMTGRVLGGVVADFTPWRTSILVVTVLAGALTAAAYVLLPRVHDAPRAPARSSVRPADDVRAHPTGTAHRNTRLRLYLMGGIGMAMFVGLYNVIGYRTQAPPFLLGTGLGSMFYLTYLAGTATASLAGHLESRVGLRTTLLVAIMACGLGVLLTLPDSMVLIWLGLAVVAAGFFMIHAVSSAMSARLSRRPSDGSGRYTFAYYAGSSAGGVLLGQAWELGAWGATTAGALLLLAVAAVVAAGLPRRAAQA